MMYRRTSPESGPSRLTDDPHGFDPEVLRYGANIGA